MRQQVLAFLTRVRFVWKLPQEGALAAPTSLFNMKHFIARALSIPLSMVLSSASWAQPSQPSGEFIKQHDSFCATVSDEVVKELNRRREACARSVYLNQCKANRSQLWAECSAGQVAGCLDGKKGKVMDELRRKTCREIPY